MKPKPTGRLFINRRDHGWEFTVVNHDLIPLVTGGIAAETWPDNGLRTAAVVVPLFARDIALGNVLALVSLPHQRKPIRVQVPRASMSTTVLGLSLWCWYQVGRLVGCWRKGK